MITKKNLNGKKCEEMFFSFFTNLTRKQVILILRKNWIMLKKNTGLDWVPWTRPALV